MSEIIKKKLKFGPTIDGTIIETDISFKSVVEKLEIEDPKDLSYDFSAAISAVLEQPEEKWKIMGLGISKFVPERILHEFYDAALMYGAMQLGLLGEPFGALADHRILLKSVSCLPELMVKYRFYLGIANDDGEYRIETGEKEDLQLIGIQDPYDRLFWLDTASTRKKIREEHGKTSVHVIGKNRLEVVNKDGKSRGQLGYRKCQKGIFRNERHPVCRFLDSVYTNVRIPEYHGCRLGDNAIFQLDEIMANMVKAMNYLFTEDLDMSYERKERRPFSLRLFRLAGTLPLPKDKMLVHHNDLLVELQKTAEYY